MDCLVRSGTDLSVAQSPQTCVDSYIAVPAFLKDSRLEFHTDSMQQAAANGRVNFDFCSIFDSLPIFGTRAIRRCCSRASIRKRNVYRLHLHMDLYEACNVQ